jgi:DNA polymerase (family X)
MQFQKYYNQNFITFVYNFVQKIKIKKLFMKDKVIEILNNIAKLLEIKGEMFFKYNAYVAAADKLKSLDIDIESMARENKLSEIDGIGKALDTKISEFVLTGKMSYYEKLTAEYPESLLELLKIDGLGAKKIKQIFSELGIIDIDELESSCINGDVAKLKGFSEVSQTKILESIQHIRSNPNYKVTNIHFRDIQ